MARMLIEFVSSDAPVDGLVTKFGGRPTWLAEPQWPLSRSTGRPMMFIGQVAIPRGQFPASAGKMAYVFMSHAMGDEEHVDDTWEPFGGENAVIVQPGRFDGPCLPLRTGPSVRTVDDQVEYMRTGALPEHLPEWGVRLRYVPQLQAPTLYVGDPRPDEHDEDAVEVGGSWVGGRPVWMQNKEEVADGWPLLLQLGSGDVPFDVNFGDAGIGYVFLDPHGEELILLWQCA